MCVALLPRVELRHSHALPAEMSRAHLQEHRLAGPEAAIHSHHGSRLGSRDQPAESLHPPASVKPVALERLGLIDNELLGADTHHLNHPLCKGNYQANLPKGV